MRTETEVAAMQCPVCRVPLAMSDRQGIEIDYCPQCRGGVAVAPAADELDVEREPGGMVVETPDHGRGHGGETHEPPTLS